MSGRWIHLVSIAVLLGACTTVWGQKKASNPIPADGQKDATDLSLRWTAGTGMRLHSVYLGTDPNLGPENLVLSKKTKTYYVCGDLEPGVTYYWRVDEVETDQVTTYTGDVWSFTVQALSAYLPDPADKAVTVFPTATLAWWPGQGAMRHHVFLSENQEAVTQGAAGADKGWVEAPDAMFTPSDLQGATTYYWRVDEETPDGVVEGPVWSFTTVVLIDDFEKYTDKEGEAIFEAWLDGYSDHSSGSMVGNLNPPYAEQTTTHSGAQSMPFTYDNSGTPFFSEAKIEFSPAADWTANGVDTLTLHVRSGADLDVPSVSTPPVLDGKVDDAWSQASVQYIGTLINGAALTGPADCSGSFRMLYDTTNLYVLVDVNDDQLVQDSDPAQGWLDDRVEIFIDGGNDKTAAHDTTNDYQYCFRWNHGTVETPVEWYSSPASLTGVQYGIVTTTKGYLLEVKLPWLTMIGGPAKAGRLFGIDVVIDDDDDGGDTMDSQLAWHLPTGDPHRPVYWGTAHLAEAQAKATDKLYVMLEDSTSRKVVVPYPDQAILKSAQWVEWRIPLSSFAGMSLAKVHWLYVGVGDRDHPAAGGAGKLFFDDIYVTGPAPK